MSEQLVQDVQSRGNLGFSVARLVPSAKAPFALAGFLSLPIFFASLMAVSLAIEKARVVEWSRPNGKLIRIFHDPPGSNEAKIWLLTFFAPMLLVLVGFLASHLRFGIYVVCGAAIIDALALTVRLGRWERHHTARFPFGEDLYPDSSTSSLVDRGQWEHEAAHTVQSLVGYAVGLSVAAAAITLFLAYRRSRRPAAARS